MIVDPLASVSDGVLLLARVVFGVTFLYYGWPKLKNPMANARDFEKMGFKPGWFWGTPVALLEFFGGLAVIAGFGVWFFAAGFVVHMTTGAVWKITKTDKPFSDWSYDLLLWVLALLFLAFGPGSYVLGF